MGRMSDLTGKKFERLLVLERIFVYEESNKTNKGKRLCQCDCGNKTISTTTHLKSGHAKSCGCYKINKAQEKVIDLFEKRFGRLLVINRADNYVSPNGKTTFAQWLCRCDCGNEKIIIGTNLRNGSTKSCGCIAKEVTSKRTLISISGKRYGRLVVLSVCPSIKGRPRWLCHCDCGNKIIANGRSLKRGHISSCGCLIDSLIALEVKKYCKEKYKAILEYKILQNKNSKQHYRYDIYIPFLKIFIEINGQQHYKFTPFWHKTKEKFNESKKRDKIKKNYAKKNGIYVEIDLRKTKKSEFAIEHIEKIINITLDK